VQYSDFDIGKRRFFGGAGEGPIGHRKTKSDNFSVGGCTDVRWLGNLFVNTEATCLSKTPVRI
jgi:hypothetical protein